MRPTKHKRGGASPGPGHISSSFSDAAQIGQTTIGEVVFQPGVRSRWHAHLGGQAITVTRGCGWTRRERGPIVCICRGDTAYVPTGIKRWHGATSTKGMPRLSVTETIGRKTDTWFDPATDAQFLESEVSAKYCYALRFQA